MSIAMRLKRSKSVVPRKGDVDRNEFWTDKTTTANVVPRKGDVDRNASVHRPNRKHRLVVPRKGDVDRNLTYVIDPLCDQMSSPARGTWIEICGALNTASAGLVVPRKGDVDRNFRISLYLF